jgi:CheY-like chemotaxis protein
MAKILLVEDNEMNRDMLSRRLAKRGYEVGSPWTAARALTRPDRRRRRSSSWT